MKNYDRIIVGGGAMGAATAYRLTKSGLNILLLEQFKISNSRNASQDLNKAFRGVYADNTFYTELVKQALPLWRELEEESKTELLCQCGVLLLGPEEDDFMRLSVQALQNANLPVSEWRGEELRHRFPAFRADYGVLDESGGFVRAADTVHALIRASGERLHIREEARVTEVKPGMVRLQSGEKIYAEDIIVCAGAWSCKLLDLPLRITHQPLIYIEQPAKKDFSPEKFPVFGYLNFGYYGFPTIEGGTVKVSTHDPGRTASADDEQDRVVHPNFVKDSMTFLSRYIPDLAMGRVVKEKVCFYSMTHNEDFILKRLAPGLLVGAGFSGHGFKFVPLIGKMLAALSTEENPDIPERFSGV